MDNEETPSITQVVMERTGSRSMRWLLAESLMLPSWRVASLLTVVRQTVDDDGMPASALRSGSFDITASQFVPTSTSRFDAGKNAARVL